MPPVRSWPTGAADRTPRGAASIASVRELCLPSPEQFNQMPSSAPIADERVGISNGVSPKPPAFSGGRSRVGPQTFPLVKDNLTLLIVKVP